LPALNYTPTADQLARHEAIRQLRIDRGESLSEFAAVLSQTVKPPRVPRYTNAYISQIINGKIPIIEEVWRACRYLMALEDEVSPLEASLVEQTPKVLAVEQIPDYTVVTARVHGCGWPGCRRTFIPEWPTQRYCDWHREAAERRRRDAYNEKRRARRRGLTI
jgi:transcriptional regulator with XRE-family HTH domain